ncbi:MAG: nitroreductase [Xanthomonadaceae bacterium]|nr:nitroreductase [Xanthomonadaceae bacterium]
MQDIVRSQSIAEVIRNRRSIDSFRPELPPRENILAAIDSARWAPNHRLTEPWHFYLCGPETRRAIIDLNAEITRAKSGDEAAERKRERWSRMPGFLVVTCDLDPNPLYERENYAATCCAVQNLMLHLWDMGIGTKWTTGDVTRDSRFYDLIWVDPLQEVVVGLLWYGYPAETPDSTRRPVEAIVTDLP